MTRKLFFRLRASISAMQEKKAKAVKATHLSILGNLGMVLVKGIGGYFGNSYALIADAIESGADVFASLLVLFGLKYAIRPADKEHPYGHGRIEPLITFLVVGFLVASAVLIAYESIKGLQSPHAGPKAYTLLILGAIILVKEGFYRVISRRAKETGSSSLKADAWHHRSDAITSVTAFIGISIALIFGPGYEHADNWAALFASCFILYNSYHIFRPALAEIMDEHLYDGLVASIREVAMNVPGVVGTEKCYVRKTGMMYHVDLHMTVKKDISIQSAHAIGHALKSYLIEKFPEISDVLVHAEPDM